MKLQCSNLISAFLIGSSRFALKGRHGLSNTSQMHGSQLITSAVHNFQLPHALRVYSSLY